MIDKNGNVLSVGDAVVTNTEEMSHRGAIKDLHNGQAFVKWFDGGGEWVHCNKLVKVEIRA